MDKQEWLSASSPDVVDVHRSANARISIEEPLPSTIGPRFRAFHP
jgi:hypothetical protein